jgi:UDP-3-O-[3-hydroxymyristoyl] glucosamine N-acyltransferase
MEKITPSWSLVELAELLGGAVADQPEFRVKRPVPANSNDPEGIAFCESDKYLRTAESSGVGALILPPTMTSASKPTIHHSHPRLAFGMLLAMAKRPMPISPGIHPTAVIHSDATIAPTASIGAYAVVEPGASIGDGAKIYPFCYVGDGCSVGTGSTLFPHVVLYQDVAIGDGCVIHSGAVLGADGFGFMWDGSKQHKIPQVGRVELAKDVEVGANTAIDRATAGSTKIGHGTKLDNLIQIGHNVEIGRDSVIAACAAVGGSASIGDRVSMGGSCAVVDHGIIGDDVMVGGASSVSSDLPGGQAYFGSPAIPARQGLRAYKAIGKLPDLMSRLRSLEKRVKELEEGKS